MSATLSPVGSPPARIEVTPMPMPHEQPEVREKIEACPDRGEKIPGGSCCATWRCARGHGFNPGVVGLTTCGRCITGQMMEQETAKA
jgi:hypothetical protein